MHMMAGLCAPDLSKKIGAREQMHIFPFLEGGAGLIIFEDITYIVMTQTEGTYEYLRILVLQKP